MKIKKMTATFGALDHAVLEPGEGLTVVTAPNEGGKSTWAGFLRAMLYGIDTRERDKAGSLADKTRYQPWSGAPMTGELRVEWQGKDITIRRFPTRASSFGGFEAVYTYTGDPVPGLTAGNVGEQLTGVGREAYRRSAFVGQGGAAVGASQELEARVSALASSGQEDVSYSAVEGTLKDWRRRRRANRSAGLIPQLEEERAALEKTLREAEEARAQKARAEERLRRLEERQKLLKGELSVWDRLERRELNRRYARAYEEWEQMKAEAGGRKPHPVFASMTGEEAWAYAKQRQREREAIMEENRRLKDEQEALEASCRAWQRQSLAGAAAAGVLVIALILWGLLGSLEHWQPFVLLALALAGTGAFLFFNLRRQQGAQRTIREITFTPVPDGEELLGQAAEYREQLAKDAQAQAAEAAARRRVDELAAQGGQLADTLELLQQPEQSRADLAEQLRDVERELFRAQSELSRTEGVLVHMGVSEALESRKEELEGELARRLEEYDALGVALEALSAANDELRQRFSPALNRRAGERFAALTGGRWSRLTLDRNFAPSALAQGSGEAGSPPRSAQALSAGTAEQMYLAVRLAVCDLTVPDAPLVLDDALTAFDDQRMAFALELLREEGKRRQVILFSCQSREENWARSHGVAAARL